MKGWVDVDGNKGIYACTHTHTHHIPSRTNDMTALHTYIHTDEPTYLRTYRQRRIPPFIPVPVPIPVLVLERDLALRWSF